MDSGVAKRPIFDLENYRNELRARLDPIAEPMQQILEEVRANPARVAFAEGEEERVMRAAVSFRNAGFGTPILVGDEDKIKKGLTNLGHGDMAGIEIASPNSGSNVEEYTEFLYQRLQRQGVLQRECERMVRVYRTVFAACMVASGDADAIITGGTRSYNDVLDDVQRVLDPAPDSLVFGLSILVARGRTIFIADTTVRERPTAEELARIAIQSADLARLMGHEPRVAMLSFSNFGNPVRERTDRIRDAVGLLDEREVSFEYDGEMTVDVALNPKLLALYPFCRLSEPANILIMPGLHSANISAQLLQEFGGGNVIGPLVVGMSKPAQIVQMGATDSDIVTLAALAAHGANR
jgi:malate dehydrogenase (oxaloacetate-decarboxylating)(NADP+)